MDQLVNFIIRPPRADYSPKNDLLEEKFMLKGRWYKRKDVQVKNDRGNVLQCSHYMPSSTPETSALPCVIYCHGNSGCRADASEAAIILLPSNITLFTLDFSGSGLSEGEHVTLGWNEKEDLRAVVNYLRTDGNVSCIGLWGRSMGAVTSLMYGAEDPTIAGMVLDSPFSNLMELMMELVDSYKYPLPKFTVKLAIQHMRKVIKRKANFDIMDLDAIQVARRCFVPVLLGHASDDDFIQPHHSDRICDAYAGDKNIIKFDGDHNSLRPQFYFDSITIFFHNVLNPPKVSSDDHYDQTVHDYLDQDNWDIVVGSNFRSLSTMHLPSGMTDDDINQVRLRRPMSRMEIPHDVCTQDRPSPVEDNESGSNLDPSSSNMIGFDVSNGHIYSSRIPISTDNEFMEYSLDMLSDIPSSMEEEERMLMEAVMESIRDQEIQHSQGQQPGAQSTNSPYPQDDMMASKSKSDRLMTTNDSSTSTCRWDKEFKTLESVQSSEESGARQSYESSVRSSMPTNDSSSQISAGDHVAAVQNCDISSSPSDANVSDGTRATLVVHKNPSGHILDGLIHRWGGFFKNGK